MMVMRAMITKSFIVFLDSICHIEFNHKVKIKMIHNRTNNKIPT